MKILITLEDVSRAMVSLATATGTALVGYFVNDLEVHLDSYVLADRFVSALLSKASSQTLEYAFCDCQTIRGSVGASSKLLIDSSHAVSRCVGAFAVSQIQPAPANASIDHFQSEGYPYVEWQFSIGALLLPLQSVRDVATAYAETLRAFSIMGWPQSSPASSYRQYVGCEAAGTPPQRPGGPVAAWGSSTFTPSTGLSSGPNLGPNTGLIACTCERSSVLSLTGLSTLQGNSLRLNAQYSTTPGGSALRDIWFFLRYVAVCRATLENVDIRS
jgi:hypothetical protein